MRRIILHAGTEKTGSTFLQAVFSANASMLKKFGILYPESGRVSGHHYWVAKALGFKYKPGHVDEAEETKALRQLKKEITSWSGDVLLSSEHFDVKVTEETVNRLRDFFENEYIYVILVVRNQVDYSQSLYAEGLKWTVIHPYDQFLTLSDKHGRYSYLRRYQLWERIVDKVSIIDYEKYKKNLLETFFLQANLNFDVQNLKVPKVAQNVSPSIDFLEMIRICNVDREPHLRREFYEKYFDFVVRNVPELLEKRSYCLPEGSMAIFRRETKSNYILADILGQPREVFLGGALTVVVLDYQKYPEPDALIAVKKVLPLLAEQFMN